MKQNIDNAIGMMAGHPNDVFVDLGCGNGDVTKCIATCIHAGKRYGVEYERSRTTQLAESAPLALEVRYADLNAEIPFDDNSVDVIFSNQVIEHLHRPLRFLKNIHKALKPGGIAVISTENAASWHNIAALVLGYQMFSATCCGDAQHCGNPLSVWRGIENPSSPFGHLCLFTVPALRDIARQAGFRVTDVTGSGYYPLPNFVAKMDVRHSHYITIKIIKD